MRALHLLIKPASGLCNLRCSYCFYRDEMAHRQVASHGIMPLSVMEAVLEKSLSAVTRECTIAFQGGEPMLAGLEFFRETVALQKKYNKNRVQIQNAIQTNGLLINEEWANFFRENRFLVGISLDGVKDTHDCNRVDEKGDGSFNRVMQAIRLLERSGVEYNVLTVVNRQTAPRAERIYQFYKRNGLQYLQFIPCLDPFGAEQGSTPWSLRAEDYGNFLCTLFDLWYRDMVKGEPVSIRQFDNYVQMLLGYPPESCGMSGCCVPQQVVEADGSVYPCDFYVLDPYRLGNFCTDTVEQIFARREELGFLQSSLEVHPQCRDCRYYPLCRGGCRRNRQVGETGPLGLNVFCKSYQQFFAHAGSRLEELARRMARNL